MNSLILFTTVVIFIGSSNACELTLGQGSELCGAIQTDIDELAKLLPNKPDISGECTCDVGKAKSACDLLATQKAAGAYIFEPVCEEIKTNLPDLAKMILKCNDKSQLKNSYAKVDQCNAQNAGSGNSTETMIEASTAMPMASEMTVQSTPVMAATSSESEQPAMSTPTDMNMMSSMMMGMDSTMKDDITPSSSLNMPLPSSSVTDAANELKITHAVLFITAIVALIFSLL